VQSTKAAIGITFSGTDLPELIHQIQEEIKSLARENSLLTTNPQIAHGSFVSVWKGEPGQWYELVHDVCKTKDNPERPDWCGTSEGHPSGYSVREYDDHCLVTVLDKDVEGKLEEMKYKKIWSVEDT
jgi:CRISPR-associated protein Cmr6